jgi:hypothetical protein
MWLRRIGIILACWIAVWVATGFYWKYVYCIEFYGGYATCVSTPFALYKSSQSEWAIDAHLVLATILTILVVSPICFIRWLWKNWSRLRLFS